MNRCKRTRLVNKLADRKEVKSLRFRTVVELRKTHVTTLTERLIVIVAFGVVGFQREISVIRIDTFHFRQWKYATVSATLPKRRASFVIASQPLKHGVKRTGTIWSRTMIKKGWWAQEKISRLLKLGWAVPHKKAAKSFTIFLRLVHHPRRPCQPSFTDLLTRFAFRQAISRHAFHRNWTEDLTMATSAPPRYFHPAVAHHLFKLDRIGFKKMAKAMIVGGEWTRITRKFLAELFALNAGFVFVATVFTAVCLPRHADF